MSKGRSGKYPMVRWEARLDAGAIRERVLEIAREIMPDSDILVERTPSGIEIGKRGGTMTEIPESIAGSWPPWAVAFFVAGILWGGENHEQMDGRGD